MGARARRRGIANAALRAARAAAREQDERLAGISQRVYNVGVELKRSGFEGDEALPPDVFVPLLAAAEAAAPGAAQLAGLPVTEGSAREVAAYLLAGFRELIVMLDPKHFEQWQRMKDQEVAGHVERRAESEAADGRAGAGEQDPHAPR